MPASEECRILGYKLIGEFVFSEIIGDFIRDENWEMAKPSVKATSAALSSSLKEGFINLEQLVHLVKDLKRIDTAIEVRDKKEADRAFSLFFADYGTVLIDAVADCECSKREKEK